MRVAALGKTTLLQVVSAAYEPSSCRASADRPRIRVAHDVVAATPKRAATATVPIPRSNIPSMANNSSTATAAITLTVQVTATTSQ